MRWVLFGRLMLAFFPHWGVRYTLRNRDLMWEISEHRQFAKYMVKGLKDGSIKRLFELMHEIREPKEVA